MTVPADFRQRARATWAAGDWDSCSRLIEPVGAVVLERIDLRPGLDLLDVGTGTGGNVAIPAARRGAKVVGLDVAPELFEHARRRAAEAGVDIEWVEGDALRVLADHRRALERLLPKPVERAVGDVAPAAVDRERMPAVRELLVVGHRR